MAGIRNMAVVLHLAADFFEGMVHVKAILE